MSRPRLLLLAPAFLAACGVGTITEENFAEKTADTFCPVVKECNRGFFDAEYGGEMKECREETIDDVEDAMELADDADCDFDADEAKLCLETFRASTCEEFYEGDATDDCEDVFEDCGFFF